tara:strand:+ start:185 stop:1096 length:912 start_codon:yes stop_codon:yes gene_type:complete
MADVREIIGRPSLDTFYQVTFSFGKWQTWLQSELSDIETIVFDPAISGHSRVQGRDFMQKMSVMCAEAEIPGTSFQSTLAVGHHQGIQEEFPYLRTFPPLNLTFYCDLDHVIIEVLESWMTYINPITTNKRDLNAYGRFNYPDDYKETIHLTKFERDTFIDEIDKERILRDDVSENLAEKIKIRKPTTKLMTYEFVNIWPQNMTSMRVAYGDSNVLRCSVQLAYDRFFTDFNYEDTNQAIAADAFSLLNSKEQNRRYGLKNSLEPTYPDGSFGIGSKSTDKVSRHKTGHSSQYKKKRRGTAFQ